MNVLKEKQTRQYDYLSRYAPFNFYYNELDDKYIYGITSQLKTQVEYVAHKVIQSDTLDSLSNYYYGRPDLYWVIADFNHIQDPFKKLFGNYDTLKIPTLSNLAFK